MTDAETLMECAGCLGLASRRAARAISRSFEKALRPHDIRIGQFSMLTALALRGPTSIGALAVFLGLERTTLTRNIALVDAKGWVRVRPGADARARIAEITPAGRRKLDEAVGSWRNAQHAAAETIGPAGVAALHRIADRSTA
jgi:DNA-binding MarR family transcriptional regulator